MTIRFNRLRTGILVVGASLLLLLPVIANAQLSPSSPFTDSSDSGSAENVNVIGTDSGQEDALINVVRGYINWILGILGLIALIMIMYGGFLMVTAAGESERYEKGFTILKQGAVGLILIGVAWFIVSIIFWLINLTGNQAGPAGTGG